MISMLSKTNSKPEASKHPVGNDDERKSGFPCPPPLGTSLHHDFNRKRTIRTEGVITEYPCFPHDNPYRPISPQNLIQAASFESSSTVTRQPEVARIEKATTPRHAVRLGSCHPRVTIEPMGTGSRLTPWSRPS